MTSIIKIPKLKVVNATKAHSATLFFFHGSASSGDDVKEWVDILTRRELNFPHIKLIYPTAPAQPYTPRNGMFSNVWFNRKDISINVGEEIDSINAMCENVVNLIDKEVASGIPYERIIVGGFSMGGALSFYTAYRYKPSLAGCFALSSFLNKNSLVYEHLKANSGMKTPPLLQCHGTKDDLVPIEWAEETQKNLKELGVNIQFTPLSNTGHELTRPEIELLRKWIVNILPEI